jgi:hypothetical protein
MIGIYLLVSLRTARKCGFQKVEKKQLRRKDVKKENGRVQAVCQFMGTVTREAPFAQTAWSLPF